MNTQGLEHSQSQADVLDTTQNHRFEPIQRVFSMVTRVLKEHGKNGRRSKQGASVKNVPRIELHRGTCYQLYSSLYPQTTHQIQA